MHYPRYDVGAIRHPGWDAAQRDPGSHQFDRERGEWVPKTPRVSLKKWYSITRTPDGHWAVQQAPGVYVYVHWWPFMGEQACRRWRLRKANGFDPN